MLHSVPPHCEKVTTAYVNIKPDCDGVNAVLDSPVLRSVGETVVVDFSPDESWWFGAERILSFIHLQQTHHYSKHTHTQNSRTLSLAFNKSVC